MSVGLCDGSAGSLRRAPLPALILLPVLAGLFAGCRGREPGNPAPASGVVLLVVDALRPDHLGAYGYARDTSPALDFLAREGVRFDSAYSTAGWTLPAVASLFTSLHPSEHGLRERVRRRNQAVYIGRLEDRFQTLAERFEAAGFATLAVVGNPHLRRDLGFAQGFRSYREVDADADAILAEFREWLHRERPARFFAYLHFMDVHWPYTPPPPYDRWFGTPKGALDFARIDWNLLRRQVRSGEVRLGEGDRRALEARYDGGIRRFDDALSRFLGEWKEASRDWLWVVTADHGEEFLEHGGLGHGPSLYEANLRVPLVLRLPHGGSRGAWVAEPVSHVDLLPTLLDLAGIPAPGGMRGRTLRPLWTGGAVPAAAPVFAEEHFEDRFSRVAVRSGGWKLIRFTDRSAGGSAPPAVRQELYDLAADPAEGSDLVRLRPAIARQLAEILNRHLERMGEAAPTPPVEIPFDPEAERRLRALGYLD